MIGLKIYIVPWMFFVLICIVKCQYCPTENSIQHGSLITWYTDVPKYIVSDPPCINERYEITKRRCTNSGRWDPSKQPFCKLFQQTFIPACPNNFITKNNHCIFISKPQIWSPMCTYFNDLIQTEPEYLKILLSLNISEFWLPVKRSQPYGKFVWFHPLKYNKKYKHPYLKKAIKEETDIYECIIVTKIKFQSDAIRSSIIYETKTVDCNAKFKQVCIYNVKSNFSPTTKSVTCFKNNKNICYTLSLSSNHQSRDRFCEKLATPSTQLQNYIIKTLVEENICWIGLKRNPLQIFQWEDTKRYLEYTDWKLNASFNKHLAAISRGGWELYNDYSLNCGVCEVEINNKEINLTLKPNLRLGILILTIYSPKYFINEEISCNAVGINDVNLTFKTKMVPQNKQNSDSILSHLSEKDDRIIYLLRPNTKFYNYYICKGIALPNGEEILSDTVLFGMENLGNEYALHMIVDNICNYPNKCDPLYNDDLQDVIDEIHSDLFKLIRPMKILNVTNNNLEVIVHLHIKRNNMSRTEEYFEVKLQVLHLFIKLPHMRFISLKSCSGCLEHSTLNGKVLLHWSFTEIGSTTMPQELCLNISGFPVTKMCIGDFISGAHWSEESGICSNFQFSTKTKYLHDFYLNFFDFTADEILGNLTSLTKDTQNLLPSDIYYVSQILKGSNFTNYSNSTLLIDNLVYIINNLISTSTDTLKLSNQLLNSTNILLDVFDKLMEEFEDVELNEDGILTVVTPFLFYQVSDVSLNNITGVVVSGPTDSNSFLDYKFTPLKYDTIIHDLLNISNLDVATFIPEEIIENAINKTNNTNIRVYISIYYNNSLFIEEKRQNKEPSSKIVSVSVMGYENYLSSPIPVLFKNKLSLKTEDLSCSYWSFGQNTYEEKYPTQWANDGGIYWNISNQNIEVCGYTHLTHFALLLGEPSSISLTMSLETAEYHDKVLSIITAIGCSLSIIGITAIIITTILFKSWRQKTGTKVLLNLCASVLLQMTVIFLADTKHVPNNDVSCIILGCILHYSTISSFCWMLAVAYLQYLRFVKVFRAITPHLVLKACIIGWILPIFPVIFALVWDSNSYNPMAENKSTGLCYPHGIAIYITVILPISVILTINIIIFCIILYNVTQKTVTNKTSSSTLKYNQLKLAVLLFFLLGLTWIFGFLTVFMNCIFCLYLFCSTATSQGFVLFVFYVLLDSTTRKLWISLLKPHLSISRKRLSTRWSHSSTTQDVEVHTINSTIITHN